MIPGLTQLYTLITGSKFLWKIITNWKVLSSSLATISSTLKKMHDENRNLPDQSETSEMLLSLSNVLKTGIIDIPGFDEYKLSLQIDNLNSGFVMGIQDAKSKKFHQLKINKGKKDV